MSSKSQLTASINAFGTELRSFVQRASDSITALQRTAEQRPQAGVQDFKECLEDLEQQVADFTDELQHVAQYTAESISFEELIGHCSAVYDINRATVLALEQHLVQYGYQQPPNAVLQPKSVQHCLQAEDFGDDTTVSAARMRQVSSTPASPVRSAAVIGRIPSRLGQSQPGSPTSSFAAAAGLVAAGGASCAQLRDTLPPLSTMRGLGGPAGYLSARAAAAGGSSQVQQQEGRASLGSNTSSTPAGLMMSPSVAALANKYATSSVGGSSIGALSVPEQQLTGGSDRPTRSPVRDLNLSYALAETHSPDMPIFGRTSDTTPLSVPPASHGPAKAAPQQQQQQQAQQAPRGPGVTQCNSGAAAAEDSTGELYNSLIHSNMQGAGCRPHEGTPESQVTPPCTRRGVSPCSSPQAPPTAGRLPATWVSEKMQQLEDLQADVTLTLSQMKRCPSRSRTAPMAGSDSGSDDGQLPDGQQQQQQLGQGRQQQQRQQQRQQQPAVDSSSGSLYSSQPVVAAAAAGATPIQAPLPRQEQGVAGMEPTATARRTKAPATASRPAYATDSLTAKAAAASADLESLMASLSLKYALDADKPAAAALDAVATAGLDEPKDAAALSDDDTYEEEIATADLNETLQTMDTPESAKQQRQRERGQPLGVGGSSLLTPATQQTIRRVVAAGMGTAAGRPQSTIRKVQPTTDVHRLEEIRGFYNQRAGVLAPQQLEARLAAEEPAAAVSSHTSCTTSSKAAQAAAAAAVAVAEPPVLRPVQTQQVGTTAAGPGAAASGAQGQEWQQQEKPNNAQQQQQELTPRAARLQRRLQLQQLQAQQQQGQDAENVSPAVSAAAVSSKIAGAAAVAAKAQGAAGSSGGAVKAQAISAEEYAQLPSWCRSLLSVDLLNSVLSQLCQRTDARGGADVGPDGFTADDVAALGHSNSKSKAIVTCLHKLSRVSLQRSATGASVYRLAGSY